MQSCLLSSSEIHHLSVLNHQNTVSDLCNFVIMGNHYNCLSIFFCCHLKQGDYLITGLRIKIACRLICKYNFRTIHQCSCNCYSLLLSSGQLIWQIVNSLFNSQSCNDIIYIRFIHFSSIQPQWQYNIFPDINR